MGKKMNQDPMSSSGPGDEMAGGLDVPSARRIVDSLPLAVFGKDPANEFRFVLWNRKQEELTGISQKDAIGKTDFDLFPHDEAKAFRKADEAVVRGGAAFEIPEERIDTPTHEVIWLRTLKSLVEDDSGQHRWLLGISEDISAQKLAADELVRTSEVLQTTQLQLIQAEKMELIGRLAAGVAHEVKNPLYLISMGLDYFKEGIKPDDPNLPILVAEMSDALDRADKIVRGLLDFSVDKGLDLADSDLVSLVDRGLHLVRYDLTRSGVVVDVDVEDNLSWVIADRSKFEQVLVNVLTNAVHAVEALDGEDTGHRFDLRMEMATVDFEMPDEGVRGCQSLRLGEPAVLLRIRDTGAGLPEGDADRVFDPFFTTKDTGKGTGLGLSVVRKIISLHGGHISLRTRGDGQRGAEVQIFLRPAANCGG